MPSPSFSLYPAGFGSVELLGGAGIDWSEIMDCSKCGRRDGCAGPSACEREQDALTAAEVRRDG
ncbi:MAG: hypothetical protein BWY99_02344 [Synergistetes bacterium ADurb.BinA166]|nr:MAG: hypothetical protein BWY99_02344 [Synergistetes bacterium ADurb.BinA166]